MNRECVTDRLLFIVHHLSAPVARLTSHRGFSRNVVHSIFRVRP